MGYGPDCPYCKTSAEWTQGEIDEVIFGAKTYCCSNCYGFYVLTSEEVEKLQLAAQALQNPSGTTESQIETEED